MGVHRRRHLGESAFSRVWRARTRLTRCVVALLVVVLAVDVTAFAGEGDDAPEQAPPTTPDTTEPPPASETPTMPVPAPVPVTTAPAAETETATTAPEPEPESVTTTAPAPSANAAGTDTTTTSTTTTIAPSKPPPELEGQEPVLEAAPAVPTMMLSGVGLGEQVDPSAPRNLRVADRTETTLTLEWDPPASGAETVDYYHLQAATVDGGPWWGDSTDRYETSATVLWSSDSSSRFSVYAVSPEGASSDRSNIVTVYRAPRQVSGLEATPGDGSVNLTWEEASLAEWPGHWYRVEQWRPDSETWDLIDRTLSPHHIVSGLTNGVEYRYRVVLEHQDLEGPPSDEVSVTPEAGGVVPSRPTLLAVDGSLTAGPGLGMARVEWEPPASVPADSTLTGFAVQYNPLPVGYGWVLSDRVDSVETTSHVLHLAPGSDYSVRVVPIYEVTGEPDELFGVPSNIMYVSVASGAPTNLRAVGDIVEAPGGRRSIRLEWDAPTWYTGIVGYRVEAQMQHDFFCDPNCWFEASDTLGPDTAATISPDAFMFYEGIEFRFRVRAVARYGGPETEAVSGPSNVAQGTPWTSLDAPSGVTAAGSERSVHVAWDEPAVPTTHEVQFAASSSGPWYDAGSPGTESELTVEDLEPGVEYWFRVRIAPDAPYIGVWSAPVAATPTGTPAAEPTDLRAVDQTDTNVTLAWTEPVGPVDHYVIEHRGLYGDWWEQIGTSGEPTFTTSGSITRHGRYRVYAVAGDDRTGYSNELVAYRLLPAVSFPSATAGDASALVEWTALSVADWPGHWYRVERSDVSTPWTVVGRTQSNRVVDTGLVNGATYAYRIVAEHGGREGPPSADTNLVMPTAGQLLPPGAPTLVSVDVDLDDEALELGQARVTWTPPAPAPGHAAVENYVIEYLRVTSGFIWDTYGVGGDTTTQTLNGLEPGTTYAVRVVAIGRVNGSSRWGEPSNVVFVTVDPGAPTDLRLADTDLTPQAGDDRVVSLAWDAPIGYGGIAGYAVEFQPAEFADVCDTRCSWWNADDDGNLFTGTTATMSPEYFNEPGLDLRFRVSAVTSVARSGPSTMVSGTPWLVLGSPTGVSATGGDRSVLVDWDDPIAPRSHEVQYATSSNGPWSSAGVTADASEFTVNDLDPDTTYWFRVRPVATAPDLARWSETTSAITDEDEVTVTVPSAVIGLGHQRGDGTVTLTWRRPASDGGSPLTGYRVDRATSPAGPWTEAGTAAAGGDSISATVGGDLDVRLWFRVVAVNVAGDSVPETVDLVLRSQPSRVAGTEAAAALGGIDVTWEPATAAGSSPDLIYHVGRSTEPDDGYSPLESTGALGLTDTTAVPGVTYWYRVYASNGEHDLVSGEVAPHGVAGDASAPASATFVERPGPPTITTVSLAPVVGLGEVWLQWSAPTSDGGSPIVDYVVEYQPESAGVDDPWIVVDDGFGATPAATVGGLTIGTSYRFRVSAVNAVGTGSPSPVATATPPALHPGAPTAVVATRSDGTVNLAWAPPVSTGGSPLTGYRIERRADSDGSGWSTLAEVGADVVSFSVTGPLNEPSRFRVRAVSDAGAGDPSGERVGTVRTMPPAVTGLAAAPGNGEVLLTWEHVLVDQPAALVRYVVEQGLTSGGPWTPLGVTPTQTWTTTSSTWTLTGLTNGTAVSFRVTAVNGVGDPIDTGGADPGLSGPPSTPATTTPVAGVPSSPLLLFERGDGTITFRWFAPESDGGSPITGYRLERMSGSSVYSPVGTTDGLSMTITPTEPVATTIGARYRYRVVAINANGAGTASNSFDMWLRQLPVVTDLVATPGDGQVTLNWTTVGSDSSTEYRVERAPSLDGPWISIPPSGSVQDTSTTASAPNGVTSYWRVSAVNGSFDETASSHSIVAPYAGPVFGPATEPVAATPLGPPSAPTGFTFQRGDGTISFTWEAPPDDGSSPITAYVLERAPASSNDFLPATVLDAEARSIIVTAFEPTPTRYRYRVVAVNDVGWGTPSNSYETRLRRVPVATNLQATPGVGQVALTWTATGTDSSTRYHVEQATNPDGPWSAVADDLATEALTVETIGRSSWRVRAVNGTNDASEHPASAANNAPLIGPFTEPATATGYALPGAPTITGSAVAPVVGLGEVRLTWSPPASDGGAPITSYVVETRLSATEWGPVTPIASTATSATFNADIGLPRQYRVVAVNSAGSGPPSAITTVTATSVPSAPATFSAWTSPTAGATVNLSWGAPMNSGGLPITGWVVEYQIGSAPPQVAANAEITSEDGVPGGSAKVSGLAIGTLHRFRVRAVNAVGMGTPTTFVPVTPQAGVPSAPRAFLAQPGNASVMFTWEPPASDGGAPIVGYTLSASASPSGPWTVVTTNAFSGIAVGGFGAGDTHWFRLVARNSAGLSEPAIVSGSPMAPPSTPIIYFSARGDGWTRFQWMPPIAPVGGIGAPGAASVYRVERATSPGGPWATVATTSERNFTVLSPTHQPANATRYYRVVALNAGGAAVPTGAFQVVVRDAPSAVNGLVASVDGSPTYASVRLLWQPVAAASGAAITYRIERADSATGPWSTLTPDSSDAAEWVGYVVGGATQHYRVTALNGDGDVVGGTPGTGAASGVPGPSTQREVLQAKPPTPPRIDRFDGLGDGIATLIWKPPAWDGYAPVTGYRFERQASDGGWITIGTSASPALTVHQAPNVQMTYRAFAINAAGESPPSSWWPVTLRAAPAPVSITLVRPYEQYERERIELGWTAADAAPGESINYRVERAESPEGPYTTLATTDRLTRTFVVDHLTVGTTYWYRVVALSANPDGTPIAGPPSEPVAVTYGAPEAAAWLTATPGVASATLRWHMPEYEGAAPVESYLVQRRTEAGNWVTVTTAVLARAAAQVNLEIPGLTVGAEYPFRVIAVNAFGEGVPSNVAFAVPLGDGLPNCFDSSLDGLQPGLPPSLSPPSASLPSQQATPCRPIGLGPPPLMVNGALPAEVEISVPSAPVPLVGTPAMGRVELAWSAPTEAGVSAVTGYVVQRFSTTPGTSGWIDLSTLPAETTSYSVGETETAHGTRFSYRVVAVNTDGFSGPATVDAGPFTVPPQPAIQQPVRIVDDAKVTWTVTAGADGGTPITGFVVSRGTQKVFDGDGLADPVVVAELPASAREFIDDLTFGDRYYYQVHAINAVGPSLPSSSTFPVEIPLQTGYRPWLEAHVTGDRQITVWYGECSINAVTDSLPWTLHFERSTNGTDWTDWRTADYWSSATGGKCEQLVDTGLTPGTTYHYRVWAEEPGGIRSTNPSRTDSATALSAPLPPVITGMTTLAGRVTITFIPSPSVTDFWQDDTWIFVEGGCTAGYGLFRVYDVGEPDESEWLSRKLGTFQGTILGGGQNFKATNVGSSSNKYELGSPGLHSISFDATPDLFDSGSFRLRACTAAGISNASNTVTGPV